MDKIKVGIAGCLGRMGQELVKITTKDKRIKFVGGYDLKNSKTHSNDIFQGANIIIDFSSPAAIKGNISLALSYKTGLVVGTTGLNHKETILLKKASKKNIPTLGVCLGHQAIGQAFGGKIIKNKPMHGKVSNIYHYKSDIFKNLTNPFKATRYHSLSIERKSLPNCLKVTAELKKNGMIMGIKHKKLSIYGVQFHPESIASQHGHDLIKNFLELSKNK